MKTRNINEVLKDLDVLKNADVKDSVFREKTLHYISELNTIKRKDERHDNIMLVVAAMVLLFSIAYFCITYLSKENLQQNVAEKNEIIDKYENFLKPESKYVHTITYMDKNGKEVTIPQLLDENVKLLEKVSDLEFKLNFIRETYGIIVIENGNTYSLKADKVDSALMLLESYRDKIKYDTKKKAWTIHRTYADDKVETTRSRNQNKDK